MALCRTDAAATSMATEAIANDKIAHPTLEANVNASTPATRDPGREVFRWNDLPAEIQNMITELHVSSGEVCKNKQHGMPAFTAVSSALRKHALPLFYKNKTLRMAIHVLIADRDITRYNIFGTHHLAEDSSICVVATRLVGAIPCFRLFVPDFHHIDMLEHVAKLELRVVRDVPRNKRNLLHGRIIIEFPYHPSNDAVFHPLGPFSLKFRDGTDHTALDAAIKAKLGSWAHGSKDGVVLSVDLLETMVRTCHNYHKEVWVSAIEDGTPVRN